MAKFAKGNTINLGRKRPDLVGNKHALLGRANFKDGRSKHPDYQRFFRKRRRAWKHNNGGTHTIEQWEELKARFDYECLRCGDAEPYIRLTEDHILPLSLGGGDEIENIQPLCVSCNSIKHTKTINYIKEYEDSQLQTA